MTRRPRRRRCSSPSAPGSRGSTNVTPIGSAGGTDTDPAPAAPALGGSRPPRVFRHLLARRGHAVAGDASASRPGDRGRGAGGAGARGRLARWIAGGRRLGPPLGLWAMAPLSPAGRQPVGTLLLMPLTDAD